VRPCRDYQRFVTDAPNDLWQIDFMGQPDLPTGKVHPLTVLDDHSRFALLVAACATEQAEIVAAHVLMLFRRYGLPRRILTDNGSPWGTAGTPGLTALEASWLRLGIAVAHGRPRHPQTQGKVERLHRTIWAEVRGIHAFPDLGIAQRRPRHEIGCTQQQHGWPPLPGTGFISPGCRHERERVLLGLQTVTFPALSTLLP
jgi:transposase InsO family protein